MPNHHPLIMPVRYPLPRIGAVVIALAVLAAVLGGCLRIDRPPADLASLEVHRPGQFASSTQPAGRVSDNWLAEVKDPTLVALADEAMRNNPDLRAAAARWEEAQARTRVARSFLWPELSGAGSAARVGSGVPVSPGGGSTYNQYSVAAQVAWEPDVWGRVRSDAASARQIARAVELDYAFARQSLASSLAETWFLAIRAKLQLSIDQDRLETERRTAQITRDKVQTGAGTQLEAELADANVATAVEAVHRDEQAIAELTKALEALLGRYPSAELAVTSRLPVLPTEVGLGIPSELLERRPDVVAADQRVAAAFHGVQSARAARLPRVTLTSSLGSLIDPEEMIWSIGANLLAPIFTGGRLQGQVEIATAQQRQALASYVSVAIEAFREVETALGNEQYLSRRLRELEQASARLRNASRIAEDRYNAGIMSIIDLMVIRRQDFETRAQVLQVQTDRLRQRLVLYRALGGSFDATPTTVPAVRTDRQEQSR